MDTFADYAYEKMSTLHPSASTCWRYLYTDTCLLRSLSDIESQDRAIALDAIARLDRAIIIAGASGEGRLDLILQVIKNIQSRLPMSQFAALSRIPPPFVPVSPVASPADIPQLSRPPSLTLFHKDLSRSPFILRGFINDWPAIHDNSWQNVDYLRLMAGPGRIVPVEVGKDYRGDDWTQKLMQWDDFLDAVFTCKQRPPDEVLYLAQHNLLMQFPELRNDIRIPDYVYVDLAVPEDFPAYMPPGNDEQLVINVWLGPKGTVSPAHTVSVLRTVAL
jgi:hypothetical protein